MSTISRMVSSLMSKPCSMQSMPDSIATRTADVAVAVRGDPRPARCASSTMAASSSVGVLLRARWAGVRHHTTRRAHLMTWAPCLIW